MATSRAELKILQLELWLEPARLGLITKFTYLQQTILFAISIYSFSILGMATTSALIAQFYETEGMSHFAHANMTSVLVAQRASPGDIAVSGETITDLSYEFDDAAYAWDKTRYVHNF